MASDSETQIASAFMNAQEDTPIRYAVDFLGHSQPRTTMQVDNTNDIGFANNTIKQTRSKYIDMRFNGYEIGKVKVNLTSTGTQDYTTLDIISPNFFHPP